MDEEMTTVQIFKKTAEELDIIKEYDKQPYREIIAILVKRNSGRIVKISDVKKEDVKNGDEKSD